LELFLNREGINGTIAAEEEKLTACIDKLIEWALLNPLDVKYSWCHKLPFYRMRITIKEEIVTMGVFNLSPSNISHTKKVTSSDWNKLLRDENTIVIDTRNDYEVKIGTFQNAMNPNTKSFREFPSFVENNLDDIGDKNIAIFCTGGIRCEKAAAYLESKGIYNVYNLQGGILKYLEDIAPDESLWRGECFVFDQRISVVHGLQQGSCQLCRSCRSKNNSARMKNV